ncbi:MAG: putative lipid II flippase FtsW, partial [Candidatus Aureabacteria bacterium]|nr:putative lipid II flippase FtsW [Candidatus Auribacterota bacterium]
MQQRTLLFFAVVMLLSIGIVMIYSTSAIFAQERFNDSYYYLKRQALWIALGLAAFAVAVNIDYHNLRRRSIPLLMVSIALLGLVCVPGIGRMAGGARRWLWLGGFSIQPSELAKFALILYLADVMARKQRQIDRSWKSLVLPLVFTFIMLGLVIIQPDLGTTILMALITIIMLFVAGVRLRLLLPIALAAIPTLYVLVFSSEYRKRRIVAFLNPWADPGGTGFQIIQSFIALGSGGITGLGLAQSRQKFYYLPAAHTDFIFSIIGEETGLIGAAVIVTLFVILLILGMRICWKAPDFYGHLLALGIVAVISMQAIINIAVVTGTLPTKGLPLPFISFGGSN